MPGRDHDTGGAELRDEIGRSHLGRERDECPSTPKGRQQTDRAAVELAQLRGVVNATALGVEIGTFDVDAEHARHFRVDRGAHGGDGARDDVQIVADERGQEAGRAEPAMGLADLAYGVDRRHGVEEHAAAAVHLRVEKTREEEMAAEIVALGAGAPRIPRSYDIDDPASIEQHDSIVLEAGVAKDATVDERDRHQTVSVTLRRCGGRSGSSPRAIASALASP